MDDVDVRPFCLIAFGAVEALAMLVLLLVARRSLSAEVTKGNTAERLLAAGQIGAVFLVAANAVKTAVHGADLAHDALWAGAFGVVGVVLIVVTGEFGIRLLLQSRLPQEIARGNVAAGLAGGAHFLATGIITSRAMAGSNARELALSVVFFLVGQLTLHLFVSLFRALTTYDDAEQIAGENLAAALSYSGVALSVALIIARATEGEFTGWATSLKSYAGVIGTALALYPVRQAFVQTLLLRARPRWRGGPLDDGIALERNVGVGAIEAMTYVASALAIARLA
jgi:uncharacterized membrane protein YjfL (UPF0719 family)